MSIKWVESRVFSRNEPGFNLQEFFKSDDWSTQDLYLSCSIVKQSIEGHGTHDYRDPAMSCFCCVC